jgi:hypothetical protein
LQFGQWNEDGLSAAMIKTRPNLLFFLY